MGGGRRDLLEDDCINERIIANDESKEELREEEERDWTPLHFQFFECNCRREKHRFDCRFRCLCPDLNRRLLIVH